MLYENPDMRVVFVQNGDFRAAEQRIRSGIGETYDAQRYSMEVVERMAPQASLVAVICINAEETHDEILPSGVHSIGFQDTWLHERALETIITRLEDLLPTHLVLRHS